MTHQIGKHVSTPGQLSLLTLALLTAPLAMGQTNTTGWYGGANMGQSQATIDDARITSGLLSNGLIAGPISPVNRDLGYKVFGGYQFNKNFALEGGYFNLGQFGFSTTTRPAGTLAGDIRLKGLNLDAVGTLPITEKFSVFGRLGVTNTQANDSFAGTGAVSVLNPNPSSRDTNLKVGLGLQYALTDALSLRAEIERYRIDDAVGNKGDVDLVSVGLIYRFGVKTPTPVAHAYTPEPVALAPAPPPPAPPPPAPPQVVYVPVPQPAPPPPPPPVPTKVTFSADSLFDFDQSAVKPAGRLELDKLAADLRGVDYDVINVTGHTDRIGSHAYNQKLSTRRAEAVNAYLVESAGIPAHKISAKGVNGSDPVTKPDDCVGRKATQALITCLQPDRRVDIEVSGKR
ncbi:MAG: flagellar motor protein MotB [Comamonadaceae bacterium CG1_02_60_18]|nr:MAG: flagellar motor protein MotB [Comamonadaceae bacterium CG1_02_60_18]PIQ50702.1 MAG: flagellar motor protein MotB [Comamonadaceae bacterium CG12_big_fil_rev_8_21_14_0_65_59_15]